MSVNIHEKGFNPKISLVTSIFSLPCLHNYIHFPSFPQYNLKSIIFLQVYQNDYGHRHPYYSIQNIAFICSIAEGYSRKKFRGRVSLRQHQYFFYNQPTIFFFSHVNRIVVVFAFALITQQFSEIIIFSEIRHVIFFLYNHFTIYIFPPYFILQNLMEQTSINNQKYINSIVTILLFLISQKQTINRDKQHQNVERSPVNTCYQKNNSRCSDTCFPQSTSIPHTGPREDIHHHQDQMPVQNTGIFSSSQLPLQTGNIDGHYIDNGNNIIILIMMDCGLMSSGKYYRCIRMRKCQCNMIMHLALFQNDIICSLIFNLISHNSPQEGILPYQDTLY